MVRVCAVWKSIVKQSSRTTTKSHSTSLANHLASAISVAVIGDNHVEACINGRIGQSTLSEAGKVKDEGADPDAETDGELSILCPQQ